MRKVLDQEIGLYRKFKVERTDGSSEPGGKHEKCAHFILDCDHDPLAKPALEAYAKAAREAGYGPLADDIETYLIPRIPETKQP
ncbi:MAG: hypothetical protein DWQ07_14015 [Chloroflexi bacterium]|nr:MAG: hypothetical protein DWQ07_14015 [Chloroflexota bacterium]